MQSGISDLSLIATAVGLTRDEVERIDAADDPEVGVSQGELLRMLRLALLHLTRNEESEGYSVSRWARGSEPGLRWTGRRHGVRCTIPSIAHSNSSQNRWGGRSVSGSVAARNEQPSRRHGHKLHTVGRTGYGRRRHGLGGTSRLAGHEPILTRQPVC
jgi:hypothetical protein